MRTIRRAALAALVLLAAAGPAAALPAGKTFDLDVHTYCPASSNVCGFGTPEAWRAHVVAAIAEVNLEWEAVGISFRPASIPAPVAHADYEQARCGDDASTPVNEVQLFDDWRADVAAQHPSRISILLNFAPSGHGRTCCSELPSNPGIPAVSLYGILCDTSRNVLDLGTILAHELGHHFCLCHTFGWSRATGSPMDTLDHTPALDGPLDWDGDNDPYQCQVYDTDADPRPFEEWYAGAGAGPDRAADGTVREEHEWCTLHELSGPGAVDPGSPHASRCELDCRQRLDGQDEPFPVPTAKAAQVAMGYWGSSCRGPYVVAGLPFPAFTSGSRDRIDTCYDDYRLGVLEEVCATRWGDSDSDGICNLDDNCRFVRNTSQRDGDRDGFGDACDLSAKDPGPVVADPDLDAIDSVVDQDNDGDGCPDVSDQHPTQALIVSGTILASSCDYGVEPVYEFEGLDGDGDGLAHCEDADDDGDGICDEGGPLAGCAAGPGGKDPCPFEAGDGCHASGICPPEWLACWGAGCDGFLLKLVSLPDGTGHVFDTFRQWGRRLYVGPLPGRTASQTAQAFAGNLPAAGLAELPAVQLRLELWSRGGAFVGTVAEYDVAAAAVGSLTQGGVVALVPGDGTMDVATTSSFGLPATARPLDRDADGAPDAADNCLSFPPNPVYPPNPFQGDADRDGFGNACDPDLDGDFVVTEADVAWVQSCEGTDLAAEMEILEPDWLEGTLSVPPSPVIGYDTLGLCAAADLDENGLVDAADTAAAEAALGQAPGPSAWAPADDGCPEAGCDDGNPCTVDHCTPAGGCYRSPACDDQDRCTLDACDPATGACTHAPPACDDGSACTTDSCDPATGECRAAPVADGTACDDGSLCTRSDACQDGTCGGTVLDCNDGNACTEDACDPATGQCASTVETCDDGNPCTVDSCEPSLGCTSSVLPDGHDCDDGSLCTARDSCTGGLCAGAPSVVCNDADACTSDTCDPATGECVFADLACDDGDPCTADACDALAGCTATPRVAADPDGLGFGTEEAMSWTAPPAPAHANTYRGTIPARGMGSRPQPYDHACLESADFGGDGPDATTDPAVPAPGTGFYYLVAGEDACGEAPPGSDGAGAPRPLPSACRTPP